MNHTWTSNASLYDFGRALPAQHLIQIFLSSPVFSLRMKKTPQAQVYEPAVGTGRILLPLAQHYPACAFSGSDISSAMLDVLRSKLKIEGISNLQTRLCDVAGYNGGPYDAIILSSFLHVIKNWQDVLTHIANVNIAKDGLICLLGEEGEMYNFALARPSHYFDDTPADPDLKIFWEKYLEARAAVQAPAPQRSEIGVPWDANNQVSADFLKKLGFVEADHINMAWRQNISLGDMSRIVRERCWSSMFTVDTSIYEKALAILEPYFAMIDSNKMVVSRNRLILRVLKREY